MKKTLLVIGILVIAGLLAFWMLAPSKEVTSGQTSTTTNQSQSAVTQAQNGTAYIYDVRTPEEFVTEHVEEAINFDVEKMIAGELPEVPKDAQIYVYCRSGNRSAQATVILKDAGFTNVTDLGGLEDLRNDGVL